ncbi:hypothetical protein CKA32_006078 [Geitlerinema sp. FC II]|nr:hypothetical protein CKA32_006078 [Geitlerinema sp. FC II]
MPEEKSLFVEQQLNRWKRPAPPKPGSAFVFVGDGKPSLVVYEGEQGPTQGELMWGRYHTYYEVDMSERSLKFQEKLICSDAIEFHADIKLTYAVDSSPATQAPALIVRNGRTDAGHFLQDLAVDSMRRIARRFTHDQLGEAENSMAARIEDEVRGNGFKLTRPAFIKLSLDESIQSRLANRRLSEYEFEDRKTQIARETQIASIKQTAKFGLKGKRVELFAPLIESGKWATLLAMLDPNDPEDEPIKTMIEAILNQQRSQSEKQQRMLEIAIEKGAIEEWELGGVAKALIKEVGGISDEAIAFLEEGRNSESDDESDVDAKRISPDEFKEED